jgi:predicted nucleic acid-binding protein
MSLDLPDGTSCFIDSTIFYYALVPTPGLSDQCSDLIGRIIAKKLDANCTVQILADVVHKVMMYEAVAKTGRHRSGIIGWLNQHPEVIDHLTDHSVAANQLNALPLILHPVDGPLLVSAAEVSSKHRLLTNDSLILAAMQRHGITHLATNDDDFDRVPGITVWKPR